MSTPESIMEKGVSFKEQQGLLEQNSPPLDDSRRSAGDVSEITYDSTMAETINLTKDKATEREFVTVTNKIQKKIKKWFGKFFVFFSIKCAQLACVVYILILTFSKAPLGLVDPETGYIIDVTSEENTHAGVILINGAYRSIVAANTFQMVCLALSRMSAFSMYPVMIVVFLTKCRALANFLRGTKFSMYMIPDQHELHVYAGRYIGIDALVHGLFHMLRWGNQGTMRLLWESRTGLSGLIVLIATPLITFPMVYLKKRIRYEIRKSLHYLFYVFAIGMCFHVPVSGIPNGGFIAPVLGSCIILYFLDNLYVEFFMTEKIETTIFQVLPTGVKMSMDVSDEFQKRMGQGGIAYVCLPWIDKNQWHAFSLFEHPTIANRREVFMMKTGDWTTAVHQKLQRDTVRPVWVQGPFESPYNNAVAYDNQILVASGIGITPALSVIRSHKENRRINLIWACRDPAMLEFFLEHLYLDHSGWNLIFYTGKKELNPAVESLATNVRVIKKRPDLEQVIPNIIYGIESGRGLPEKYVPCELANVKSKLEKRILELDATSYMTTRDKLKNLIDITRESGFLFTDILTPEAEMAINEAVTNEESGHGWDGPEIEPAEGDDPQADAPVPRESLHVILRRTSNAGLFSDIPSHISRRSGESISTNPNLIFDEIRKGESLRVLRSKFQPWEECDEAKDYVRGLCKEAVLPTWGMLYCGGSAIVEKTLKKISTRYDIELHSESFAW